MTTEQRLSRRNKTCSYRILGETFGLSDKANFGPFWTKAEGRRALKAVISQFPDRLFELHLITQNSY